ncbi:MAG: hypothetical protein HGA45_28515 [Chloroflexales bacterium]|nr:hypothetical protein [Chloroflexales bacterium]
MNYDESAVLTTYIWNHYQHLMTDLEREAGIAIIGRQKAAAYDDSDDPTYTDMLLKHFGRIHRADINALLQDGPDLFRRHVRDRLLQAFPDQIRINRCRRCQRIVRTPVARLCTWCGHTWFDEQPAR